MFKAEIVKSDGQVIECGEVEVKADGTVMLAVMEWSEPVDEAQRAALTERYRSMFPDRCCVIYGPGEVFQIVGEVSART